MPRPKRIEFEPCVFVLINGTRCNNVAVASRDTCTNHKHVEPYGTCRYCAMPTRNRGADHCSRCLEGYAINARMNAARTRRTAKRTEHANK